MITAKNYAAQVEKVARTFSKDLQGADDRVYMHLSAEKIKEAIHFAIPDNAKILDDDLKGIHNQSIRLPFKTITIEYFCEQNHIVKSENPHAQFESSKRLILAQEMIYSADLIRELFGDYPVVNEDELYIEVSTFYSVNGKWIPSICGWLLPTKWDNAVGDEKLIGFKRDGKVKILGCPMNNLPECFNKLSASQGIDEAINICVQDISSEVKSVLEFIEALSCKNVEQSVLNKASIKNKQRMKSNKLPIYETKFLTIKTTRIEREGGDTNGTHKSPRQHLRM